MDSHKFTKSSARTQHVQIAPNIAHHSILQGELTVPQLTQAITVLPACNKRKKLVGKLKTMARKLNPREAGGRELARKATHWLRDTRCCDFDADGFDVVTRRTLVKNGHYVLAGLNPEGVGLSLPHVVKLTELLKKRTGDGVWKNGKATLSADVLNELYNDYETGAALEAGMGALQRDVTSVPETTVEPSTAEVPSPDPSPSESARRTARYDVPPREVVPVCADTLCRRVSPQRLRVMNPDVALELSKELPAGIASENTPVFKTPAPSYSLYQFDVVPARTPLRQEPTLRVPGAFPETSVDATEQQAFFTALNQPAPRR